MLSVLFILIPAVTLASVEPCHGGSGECTNNIDDSNALLQGKVSVKNDLAGKVLVKNKEKAPEILRDVAMASFVEEEAIEIPIPRTRGKSFAEASSTLWRSMGAQTQVCCAIVAMVGVVICMISPYLDQTTPLARSGSSSTLSSALQKARRASTLDDAKIWAVLLTIYGQLIYFNLPVAGQQEAAYDDHKTWLKGFEDVAEPMMSFITAVSLPTLCFVSGAVSQGPVTNDRIRRFIMFLVAPTILWTFIVKPVFVGFVMNPGLVQLQSSLRDVATMSSFQPEWYLQALCLWRASTFAIWHHLRPALALVTMLLISCMAAYVDFGHLWQLKLSETFAFLPYFAVGYIFPLKTISEGFEPSFKSASAAFFLAVVWVFLVMPTLLWEPISDSHCLYDSSQCSSVNPTSGNDHSLYWTRHISKVALNLVPSLSLMLVAMPRFMKSSPLSRAGPYTLLPFLLQGAANHLRNRAIQQMSLPVVTSTWGHVLVLLLQFVWVLVVFAVLSNPYFRKLFEWCLHPSWVESVLTERPQQSEPTIAEIKANRDDSSTASGENTTSDALMRSFTPKSSPKLMFKSTPPEVMKAKLPATHMAATTTEPYCKNPLPGQSAAKPFYKYLLPGLFLAVQLSTLAALPMLTFLTNLFMNSEIGMVYLVLALVGTTMITTVSKVLRCRELKLGMLPVELTRSKEESLQHIVLITAYKEPVEVLQRTMASIVAQQGLAGKPIVVIAMECKDAGREATFNCLKAEFGHEFKEMVMTEHLLKDGEVIGKASNENWAARELYRTLIQERGYDPFQTMLTIADADSIFAPAYLNQVEATFWGMQDGRRFIYNGPLNTYRNMEDSTVLVNFYEIARCHCDAFKLHFLAYTPQSNYSLTLGFAGEINFWTSDNVSEDQQTRIKAMATNFGSATTVFVPSYICNDLVEGFADRYVQAKRHQWGACESAGYMLALYPHVEFRCWIMLMVHECGVGNVGGLFAQMTALQIFWIAVFRCMYDHGSSSLGAVFWVYFVFRIVDWTIYWLVELYIWETSLKQFPINGSTRFEVVCMVLLSPILEQIAKIVFSWAPTIHCLWHGMFHGDLAYINAPKGTELERAKLEALEDTSKGN